MFTLRKVEKPRFVDHFPKTHQGFPHVFVDLQATISEAPVHVM